MKILTLLKIDCYINFLIQDTYFIDKGRNSIYCFYHFEETK